MIDLYISPNIFKEHYNKYSKLGELIRCRSVRIYLDLDKTEFEYWLNSFDLEDPVMQSLDSDDIRPGHYMISQIKQEKDIPVGLSKTILMLDGIKDKKERHIEKKYGILCMTPNSLEKKINLLDKKSKFTVSNNISKEEDASTPYCQGWEFYFNPFQGIPCNTFIFSDHYLKKDDGKFYNNVRYILKNCIKQSGNEYRILFIAGDYKGSGRGGFKEMTDGINNVLKDISKNVSTQILVEYIYCDSAVNDRTDKCDNDATALYKTTHDRFVFSNYLTVDAPKTLAAFQYGKGGNVTGIKDTQKLQVSALYADGFESNQYIQSEEQNQEAYIDALVKAVGSGINPVCEGNNRITYYAYKIMGDDVNKLENQERIKLQNRFIMDRVELKKGDPCYYLSVPHCNDWANVKISPLSHFPEDDEYKDYVVVKSERREILEQIIEKIKTLFLPGKDGQASEGEQFYRICTETASDIRKLGVVSSSRNERYSGNCFKSEKDAMDVANKIWELIGEQGKLYNDEALESMERIIKRRYFFNPWNPEAKGTDKCFWRKKVLVVGASHNCPHMERSDSPCANFCDCTSCFASFGNSKLYNTTCEYKEGKISDKTSYDYVCSNENTVSLEDTTIHEVKRFLSEPKHTTNRSYYNFSNFMFEYFCNLDCKDNNDEFVKFVREMWNNISFVNFSQNFESRCTGNNFCDSDLASFKEYIISIKPEVVIVWGEVGSFLYEKEFKVNNEDSNNYIWEKDGITFLHCYHPSCSTFTDGGKLKEAMNKIKVKFIQVIKNQQDTTCFEEPQQI